MSSLSPPEIKHDLQYPLPIYLEIVGGAMKILKIIGLGVIASLLVIAVIAILVVLGVQEGGEAIDTLSKSLAVIGIAVLTVLGIGGVSRLISD
jgi:hypothetical protein